MPTRRGFIAGLAGAAAGVWSNGATSTARADLSNPWHWLRAHIIAEFQTLPGRKALDIFLPANRGRQDFRVTLNADTMLFCASAFKGFVLAEFLRLVDAGGATLTELVTLDDTVWSLSSPVFAPVPGEVEPVSGQINVRTALDAMIARSDNTATDLILNRVGADRVRQFIASIGLQNTRIPNTTRQLLGYIFGFPQWRTITWEQLLALQQSDPYPPNRLLNPVQTMASSARDFVSFYSRALQGEFFSRPEILATFRAILSEADVIPRVVPLGLNAFLKPGSLDFNGEYALALAGGLFIPPSRWAYFGMILNWTRAEGGPPEEVIPRFEAVIRQTFTELNHAFGLRVKEELAPLR